MFRDFFIKLIFPIIFLFSATITIISQNKESNISISDKQNSYIFSGKFSIKNITVEQLDSINKISKKDAINIYNNKNTLSNWSEFEKIKGVSKKKIEILKQRVILE
ncbi:hypothetical protein JXR93_07640 [bacterium]|nr:hypothetical protein [bacterium]